MHTIEMAGDKATGLFKEQSEALARWLLDEGMTYERAGERLALEFKVNLSKGALTNFYQRRAKERMKQRGQSESKLSLREVVKLAQVAAAGLRADRHERVLEVRGREVEIKARGAELKGRNVAVKERMAALLEKAPKRGDEGSKEAK